MYRPSFPLILALFVLAGCGSSDSGVRSDKTRIGMMPKLTGIGYFKAAQQGAEEAAAELGIELVYDGPIADRSEDQVKMIDEWISLGFDTVAVAPVDPEAIAQTLRRAQQAGATVLTWDTDANPEKSGRKVFVNQARNEEIGRSLVDVMASGIEARGETLEGDYLIVSGSATASNQNVWMEHMRQRASEKYPEMNLLPHLTPGEDDQKAHEQTSEALSAHPNLKGIFGITSVSLPAAAKAVRDANRAGKVQVTGLGTPSDMRPFVKDGTVEKFVLWDVVSLGYLTVHVAYRLQAGTLKPGVHDMGRLKSIRVLDGEVLLGPPLVFDKTNIDAFDF